MVCSKGTHEPRDCKRYFQGTGDNTRKCAGKSGHKESSYIYMKSFGNLVLMKKVDDLTLDEVSGILEKIAREKGLTKILLNRDIERVRSELWNERYAKSKGAPRH